MTDRIVFLHMRKTGGTTLYRLLKKHFPRDLIYPDRRSGLKRFSQDQLQQYRLLCGHFVYDEIRTHITGPFKLVTLLREPKARILSGYYFGRSHKQEFSESHNNLHYLAAKQFRLADYLDNQAERLRDLQVNCIAGDEGSASVRLDRAKQRLRDMTAFGLTERMEESVRLIFTRLGLPIPTHIPRALSFDTLADEHDYIERIEKEPVTPEIAKRLDELTVLDRELYVYACELFAERLVAERKHVAPPADLRAARPVRVLFDVSVLGYGQKDARCRTGVYRVIENVAQKLQDSNDIELAFCAAQTWSALEGSLEYLESHRTLFPNVPLVSAAPYTEVYLGLASVLRSLQAIGADNENPDRHPNSTGFFENLRASVAKTLQIYSDVAYSLGADNLKGYDIFHSTFYPIPAHLPRGNGIATFATIHDLIPLVLPDMFAGHDKNQSEFQRMVDTIQALTPDDHVLCVSQSSRNDLLNFSPLDPARVQVVPNAANPAIFSPCSDPSHIAAIRARYGIPDGSYILGVSTLEPRKNIDHLVRCFARLVREERLSDLCLVLVGAKGWNYAPIFDELHKAGLSDERVIFTGYIDDHDLAPLYSGAFAFVYPSLYEGFGLPPLEAMQCGTPVITSNNSSLPEVVGDAGILVDPRDADALCQAMLRLYRDSGLHAELSRRSLERAKLFSWERTAEQTIAAYRAALA